MKPKTIHRASKIRDDGGVSALCFRQPRKIDLSRANWTIVDNCVTCPTCLKMIEARNAKTG